MKIILILEEVLIIGLAVLVNVAFLTLLERKILGLSQIRIGPNKVGIWGALQPAADAVKLFTKSVTILGPMNKLVFFGSPILSLILMLSFTLLISSSASGSSLVLGLLMFMLFLSLNVYPLLGAGWASNSKYALIGGLRAAAQTISYEISLAFLVLAIFICWGDLNITSLAQPKGYGSLVTFAWGAWLLWLITCVAELNRTPFDFAEGESELVSGFNIEYGASKFAMIFMAEYGMIYFLSVLTAFTFFSGQSLSGETLLWALVICSGVVWLRVTLPRFRYDLLMALTWKKILPWSLVVCQLASVCALMFSV